MKQTSAAITLPLHSTNPQAPADTSQVSLFEADDHLPSVVKNMPETLDAFNKLILSRRIEFTTGGRHVWSALRLCAGGDLSNITDMHAIAGCNASHPCYLCEIRKEDCCSTDPVILAAAPRRTLSSIRLMSHRQLGTCTGCGMEIVQVVTNPLTQMSQSKMGDKAPTKAKWPAAVKALNKTWPQMHPGIVYGHSPPINLEPWEWVICVLHLNLRIVGAMFVHLVVSNIGKCASMPQQKEAFMELFKMAGIYMKERKLDRKNDIDKSWEGKFSFAGAEAEKVMRVYPQMLEIIYPKAARETDSAVALAYTKAMNAFKQWEVVWGLLNKDLGPDTRGARADELQSASTAFVDLWVKAHKKTQGLYLHMLASHIGEMYLAFGDLRPFQAQGLEHCHSKRKQAGLDALAHARAHARTHPPALPHARARTCARTQARTCTQA